MRIGVNATFLGQESHPLEEWYLRNLMTKTTELQPSVQFVVFTSKDNQTAFTEHESVAVEDVSGVGKLFQAPTRPLEAAMAKASVDCIFSSASGHPIKTDIPLVLYALDLNTAETLATHTDRRSQRALNAIRESLARAQVVVALSDYLRDTLQKTLNVPMDKIKVAPPGLDDLPIAPQETFIDPPYVLVTGGTVAANNITRAVQGFHRLEDEIPHTLVVYGPVGKDEPPTWGERVLRIERCPMTHLTALYQHSALCLCPALYDGAGLCVLRALRAGARVVAGRVGGVPGSAGNAPIYCNPESDASITTTLRRAIEEPAGERESALRIGTKTASEFTWENCVWKTLVAFRKEKG